MELPEKFPGGVVRETQITVDEFLIEDRREEKTPHLLFFYRIARDCQHVTAPGKNGTGNLSIERREKGEGTFLKREKRLATAQLDVVYGRDAINTGRIDSQCRDRII